MMNQEIMCEVEIGTHGGMVEIDSEDQVGVKVCNAIQSHMIRIQIFYGMVARESVCIEIDYCFPVGTQFSGISYSYVLPWNSKLFISKPNFIQIGLEVSEPIQSSRQTTKYFFFII